MIKVPTCIKKKLFLWAIEEHTASLDEIDKKNVFFFISFTSICNFGVEFSPKTYFSIMDSSKHIHNTVYSNIYRDVTGKS